MKTSVQFEGFRMEAELTIKKRGLTHSQVARDLGESPVALSQLLQGYRPHYRLRRKLSRYLNIPLAEEDSRPSALWRMWHPRVR